MRRSALACLLGLPLLADPQWKAPSALSVGEMAVLELRENDPGRPPLARPPLDDRVGTLRVRSVEPSPDGRGWRIQVIPLGPGSCLVPAMDLGEGRKSPELRLEAPRTVPFGAPWMGIGGGSEDELPELPFPWLWATLLLLPFGLGGWLFLRRWRRGRRARARVRARRAFSHAWPPRNGGRDALDAAHLAGRELLVAHLGEEARSWGSEDFRHRQLPVWSTWSESLDAARFARSEPPFPPLHALLEALKTGGPR